jgi:hypothetical protein
MAIRRQKPYGRRAETLEPEVAAPQIQASIPVERNQPELVADSTLSPQEPEDRDVELASKPEELSPEVVVSWASDKIAGKSCKCPERIRGSRQCSPADFRVFTSFTSEVLKLHGVGIYEARNIVYEKFWEASS